MTRHNRLVAPRLVTGGRASDFALRRFARLRRVAVKPAGLDGWEDDGGSLVAPVASTDQATPLIHIPGSR